MNKKTIDTLIKSLFILALFSISFYSFAVWQDTNSNPPEENMPYPPFNVDQSTQQKSGSLALNDLEVLGIVNIIGPLKIFTEGSQFENGAILTSAGPDTNILGEARWKIHLTGQEIGTISEVWERDVANQFVELRSGSGIDHIRIGKNTDFFLSNNNLDTLGSIISSIGENNLFVGLHSATSIFFNDSPLSSFQGNTSLGSHSFMSLISGNYNVGIGSNSLAYASSDDSENVAIGFSAMSNPEQYGSGTIPKGKKSVALGADSLFSKCQTLGSVGIGYMSISNTSCGSNPSNSDNYNIGIGNFTGKNGEQQDASNNLQNSILIGHKAKFTIPNLQNSVAIGAHSQVSTSNTMSFGNIKTNKWGFGVAIPTSTQVFKVGTNSTNGNGAYLTNAGQWTSTSDRNKKHNIEDLSYGLNEVLLLRPVSFEWNGSNQHDIGLIAQEVKEIIPELVSGEEGDMGISYGQITTVLLKAVQEQQEEIKIYQKELEDLELRLKELQN